MQDGLITAEEALLEEQALEVVLGNGTTSFSFVFPEGREHQLTFRWPSMADEEAILTAARRIAPGLPEDSRGWRLAVARATLERLFVEDAQERSWLPLSEHGRPLSGQIRVAPILLAMLSGWEEHADAIKLWLLDNQYLNLRRIARQEHLRVRDLVAQHLGTHPFDPRVLELSQMQAYLFLELRHPVNEKDLEAEALKAEAEMNDARDEYFEGAIKQEEDDGEFDADLAIYAQSGM